MGENTNKFLAVEEFFKEFDQINLFHRLFLWRKMKTLAREAYGEIKSNSKPEINLIELKSKLENTKKEVKRLEFDLNEKKQELSGLRGEKKILDEELKIKEKELSRLTESKENNVRDIGRLNSHIENLKSTNKILDMDLIKKEKELSKLGESNNKQSESIIELKSDIKILKERNSDYLNDKKELEKKNISMEKELDQKRKDYDNQVVKVQTLQDSLTKDIQRLADDRVKEEELKFKDMKKTWRIHESIVENEIKSICERNILEYVDKSTFKTSKKPDNAIKVLDEIIVFDAKSPAGDNLDNFPDYITRQAKEVQKYIKEDYVKKDCFLVVPTNTLEILPKKYFDMGDYRVHIITKEAIDPIIKSFKKIEEYDNIQEFTPEDREKICQIIGGFAHATKRRVQIDAFFMKEFVDIWKKTERLPEDMQNKVEDYELSGKLMNPPRDTNKTKISIVELNKNRREAEMELEVVGVEPKVQKKDINTIKLYKKK